MVAGGGQEAWVAPVYPGWSGEEKKFLMLSFDSFLITLRILSLALSRSDSNGTAWSMQ